MNFNAIHNLLNFLGLIVGSVIAYDWTTLGVAPGTAAWLAGLFILADKIIKIGMNITRDGIGGMFKVQPPVT